MSKRASKQVDLVIYKGGERIVIGRAAMDPDGKIEAQIYKDIRKDVKDILLAGVIDNLSINPAPTTQYNLISSKIQETKDGQA